MADAEAIKRAKSDGGFLREVLGVQETHARQRKFPCPLCGSKDNLDIHFAESNFVFQCFTPGCKGNKNKERSNTVVDALMLVSGLTIQAAMKECERRYGSKNGTYNGTHKALPAPVRPALFPTIEPAPQKQSALQLPFTDRRSQDRAEPILDLAKADAFVAKAHKYLLEHLDYSTLFRRGISEEIIKQYKIGFIENERIKFKAWNTYGTTIPAAWVLPITDSFDRLKGVKLHIEKAPEGWDAKNIWCPFGTVPDWNEATATCPVHSYYTIWPHPDTLETPQPQMGDLSTDLNWWINQIPQDGPLRETFEYQKESETLSLAYERGQTADQLSPEDVFECMRHAFNVVRPEIERLVSGNKPPESGASYNFDPLDYLWFTPGELKALGLRSAGLMASAPTGGESWMPHPKQFQCVDGLKVALFYDDDPPRMHEKTGQVYQAGKAWALKWSNALILAGAREVQTMHGGRKEKV